jgi:hypothetical protein
MRAARGPFAAGGNGHTAVRRGSVVTAAVAAATLCAASLTGRRSCMMLQERQRLLIELLHALVQRRVRAPLEDEQF